MDIADLPGQIEDAIICRLREKLSSCWQVDPFPSSAGDWDHNQPFQVLVGFQSADVLTGNTAVFDRRRRVENLTFVISIASTYLQTDQHEGVKDGRVEVVKFLDGWQPLGNCPSAFLYKISDGFATRDQANGLLIWGLTFTCRVAGSVVS